MWYVLVKVMSEFSAQAHAGKDLKILRFPQNIAAVHDSHLHQSAFQPNAEALRVYEIRATLSRTNGDRCAIPILHRIDSGPENTAYYQKVLWGMSALVHSSGRHEQFHMAEAARLRTTATSMVSYSCKDGKLAELCPGVALHELGVGTDQTAGGRTDVRQQTPGKTVM